MATNESRESDDPGCPLVVFDQVIMDSWDKPGSPVSVTPGPPIDSEVGGCNFFALSSKAATVFSFFGLCRSAQNVPSFRFKAYKVHRALLL